MSTRFLACEACARHVREGDDVCPFCGARAPQVPPLRGITRRLSRAALHAAGAAGAIVTLNDCGTGTSVEAFYGAPCIDGSCNYTYDAGQDGAAWDGATGDEAVEVFYGGSCLDACGVLPDAGPDGKSGADASSDAGDGSSAADAGDAGNAGED
jgi:hypothetical protein